MKNKKCILLLAVILLLQLVTANPIFADETSYYRTIGDQFFKTKNTYTVGNEGNGDAFDVKATVLVGTVSDSPYQQSLSYTVNPWPEYTYLDSWGNIYAVVNLDKLKAKASKTITVEKQVLNGGISYERDIYKMGADYTWFKKGINSKQYLSAGDKLESNAPEILKQASNFDLSQSKVQLAKEIYSFVNLHIKYNTSNAYANKGALSGLRTGRGVCEEYATLFTAICRALGVPARVVNGYWINDDIELKQGQYNDVSSMPHAWAEFYLPEVGWIPVEPTFEYTYNGVRTPNMEYFANIIPGDVHLITSYRTNKQTTDIRVSGMSNGGAIFKVQLGEQSVMPVNSVLSMDAFTDISSSWAKGYINKLYNQGVLFGKNSGLYSPGNNITRGEFSAFLVNALQLEQKSDKISFKDVKDSDSLAPFIKTAAAYGLIQGSQGYFKPNDTITRQDAAVILQRAIDLLKLDYIALREPEFVDNNQVSTYARTAVKTIYNMNIMSGKPGNLFDPKNFTTRAEAAKMLDTFIEAIR